MTKLVQAKPEVEPERLCSINPWLKTLMKEKNNVRKSW